MCGSPQLGQPWPCEVSISTRRSRPQMIIVDGGYENIILETEEPPFFPPFPQSHLSSSSIFSCLKASDMSTDDNHSATVIQNK